MSVLLVNGNALRIPLADESVQMACTSPPYWGLRDYQVDDQIGLESTLEDYVSNIVAVFREVKRVLRSDGTAWINLGDSYASPGKGGAWDEERTRGKNGRVSYAQQSNRGDMPGLKPKDLCGIPWRVAFVLQADGWWLRSEITWCKKAPMPESVTDRPTSATEKVFLLSKSPRYFYDADAVRLPAADPERVLFTHGAKMDESRNDTDRMDFGGGNGANMRNYWLLGPDPYPGQHFATFPRALVEPCIKAGSSEAGACAKCGRPYERITEYQANYTKRETAHAPNSEPSKVDSTGWNRPTRNHKGFRPACTCNAPARPCLILDPFCGSGTTGVVARKLGRDFVGLDLSYSYLHEQARERLSLAALEEWENGREVEETALDGLPLFSGNGGGG